MDFFSKINTNSICIMQHKTYIFLRMFWLFDLRDFHLWFPQNTLIKEVLLNNTFLVLGYFNTLCIFCVDFVLRNTSNLYLCLKE